VVRGVPGVGAARRLEELVLRTKTKQQRVVEGSPSLFCLFVSANWMQEEARIRWVSRPNRRRLKSDASFSIDAMDWNAAIWRGCDAKEGIGLIP
jgi:hypothetical protein